MRATECTKCSCAGCVMERTAFATQEHAKHRELLAAIRKLSGQIRTTDTRASIRAEADTDGGGGWGR